jgi:hypothetical protein
MGKRGKKAPFGAVLKRPKKARRGMTQKGSAAVLPEVDNAGTVFGVKTPSPGAAYLGHLPEQINLYHAFLFRIR